MKTLNISGYGSMQNAIYNQSKSKQPEIGMGVTELLYSDRHPYTIIKIISDNKIIITADIVVRTDNNGCNEQQTYTYTKDKNATEITLFLNKYGHWKRQGASKGATYLVGIREEYYDFTH